MKHYYITQIQSEMKRNDIPIILSTAAFSLLFYRQSAGVNYFLFNALLIAFLLVRDMSLLSSRAFLAAAAGCIISSFFVFWYDTPLPFAADVISLVLLAGISFDRDSSFIIGCFHSLYSFFGTFVFFYIDLTGSYTNSGIKDSRTKTFNKIALAVIPLIIFLVFFYIYRESNPIFAEFADRINFDFISVPWCLFTIGGFILMYGFFKQRTISSIQDMDHSTPDSLSEISAEEHSQTMLGDIISVSSLIYTGVLLLILLNLLLATVNGLDIYYLGIMHATPPGVSFSQYLHNGTNSLILSIILAVSVILFYFRGYLNFYEGNKWLKHLAYIWIAQNIILVLSTAYRNTVYISDYGLTHRRIGVYVYLFLCIAGLVTTFVKINKGKNNWFLFRKNAWIVYSFMILSCPVDWDSVITSFDISRFQSDRKMEIDMRYLADLGYTNTAQLFEYFIVEGKTLHSQPDTSTSTDELSMRHNAERVYDEEITTMIWQKYYNLEHQYGPHSWQSHCMSKSANVHTIEKLIKDKNLTYPANIGYKEKY